jgi:Pretoxin HINT domain
LFETLETRTVFHANSLSLPFQFYNNEQANATQAPVTASTPDGIPGAVSTALNNTSSILESGLAKIDAAAASSTTTLDDGPVATFHAAVSTAFNLSKGLVEASAAHYRQAVSPSYTAYSQTVDAARTAYEAQQTAITAELDAEGAAALAAYNSRVDAAKTGLNSALDAATTTYLGTVESEKNKLDQATKDAKSAYDLILEQANLTRSGAVKIAQDQLDAATAAIQAGFQTAVDTASNTYNTTMVAADAEFEAERIAADTAYNEALTAVGSIFEAAATAAETTFDNARVAADTRYDSAVSAISSQLDAAAIATNTTHQNLIIAKKDEFSTFVSNKQLAYNDTKTALNQVYQNELTRIDGLNPYQYYGQKPALREAAKIAYDNAVETAYQAALATIEAARPGYIAAIEALGVQWEQAITALGTATEAPLQAAANAWKADMDAASVQLEADLDVAADQWAIRAEAAGNTFDAAILAAAAEWTATENDAATVWESSVQAAAIAVQPAMEAAAAIFDAAVAVADDAFKVAEQGAYYTFHAAVVAAEAAFDSAIEQADLDLKNAADNAKASYLQELAAAQSAYDQRIEAALAHAAAQEAAALAQYRAAASLAADNCHAAQSSHRATFDAALDAIDSAFRTQIRAAHFALVQSLLAAGLVTDFELASTNGEDGWAYVTDPTGVTHRYRVVPWYDNQSRLSYYTAALSAGSGTELTMRAWIDRYIIDPVDGAVAGFDDMITAGLTTWLREKWFGEIATHNHEGVAFGVGQWAGVVYNVVNIGLLAKTGIVFAAKNLPALRALPTSAWSTLSAATKNFVCFIRQGCFVEGTLVTVCESPALEELARESWFQSLAAGTSNRDWSFGSSSATAVLDERAVLQIPIEQVPLGARVPTKNPKPWEYDSRLPEPVQETWAKLSATVVREDGAVVDIELIRPRAWVEANRFEVGAEMQVSLPELQIAGRVRITAIDDCPEILDGDGSVVTGRFITREVSAIARVEILGPKGIIETLEGTPVHPIWSVDRGDWVSLGEIVPGDQLATPNGPATVLANHILNQPITVYNIEVHGEHVYEVGELGVLVHNSTPCTTNVAAYLGSGNYPIATRQINTTVEATIEAVSRISQTIKGTISANKSDALALAKKVAEANGIKNPNLYTEVHHGGLWHVHIKELRDWHFWYH